MSRPAARGAMLFYMPLSAFGLYQGRVINVRDDGRVDIGLFKHGKHPDVVDVELSRIEVVESRDKLHPGACYLVDEVPAIG